MVAYCFSSAHRSPRAGIMLYQLIGKLDEQRSFADYMSASKEISARETYLQNLNSIISILPGRARIERIDE